MPKKSSPKNVTLDELAGMIKNRFDDVDQRLDGIDVRLNRIEKIDPCRP